jgi:hypothetical protein
VLVCPHSLDAAVSSSYASPPETRGASFPNTLPSFEDTKRVGFQCPYIPMRYTYSFLSRACLHVFACFILSFCLYNHTTIAGED